MFRRAKGSEERADEFTCPNCRSQSVNYPDAARDWQSVTCRGCGAWLGTLAEFRRFVRRHALRSGEVTSGC
jgi:transcription elongation factor Elf1